MSQIQEIIFLFSGSELHDASQDAISQAQEVCYSHKWSLAPSAVSLNGAPTYTIEVSNDLTNWAPYEDRTDNAAIDQPFDDTHFAWRYVRINYLANDNTTGTVSFRMVIKG